MENSKELEISFGGLTHLQVVRRFGLASIALSLISSVIAPSGGSGSIGKQTQKSAE